MRSQFFSKDPSVIIKKTLFHTIECNSQCPKRLYYWFRGVDYPSRFLKLKISNTVKQ